MDHRRFSCRSLAVVTFFSVGIGCTGSNPAVDTGAQDTATITDSTAADTTTTLDVAADGSAPVDAFDATSDAGPDVATDVAADSGSTDATSTHDASACERPGVAPDLAGPNACTTLDFGMAAVPVRDVTSPIVFTGGAIPPGIYDVVDYQRTAGSLMTSMRATLVIGGDGRFTEVRVLDTGGGTSPTTRKSGTYTTSGNMLVRAVSCGGADAGMETNQLAYRVDCNPDEVLLHMGLTNLWFTYRRRM